RLVCRVRLPRPPRSARFPYTTRFRSDGYGIRELPVRYAIGLQRRPLGFGGTASRAELLDRRIVEVLLQLLEPLQAVLEGLVADDERLHRLVIRAGLKLRRHVLRGLKGLLSREPLPGEHAQHAPQPFAERRHLAAELARDDPSFQLGYGAPEKGLEVQAGIHELGRVRTDAPW